MQHAAASCLGYHVYMLITMAASHHQCHYHILATSGSKQQGQGIISFTTLVSIKSHRGPFKSKQPDDIAIDIISPQRAIETP